MLWVVCKIVEIKAELQSKSMEVEYSRGGVLIFCYLILIHLRDTFGGLYDNQVESRQLDMSEFIDCRFDGPPIACKRGLRVAS